MATLDGDAAVLAAKAQTVNQPGACLHTVWLFYGAHDSIGPHAGQYPDAIDGWRYATRQHPGDIEPPAGYPVYFDALTRPRYAGDDNYAAGDVVISLGGGLVRCTDGAGAGRMGTMTIAQRAAQIGRTYLGWTEDFLGYDVTTTATAALHVSQLINTPKPTPKGAPDMLAVQYQGSGSLAGSLFVIDPTAGTYRKPTPLEVKALQQQIAAGFLSVYQVTTDAEWNASIGQLVPVPTQTKTS